MTRTTLALSASLVFLACAPKIRISWDKPPALVLPTTQKVAVEVKADGIAPSATQVMDAVIGVTQGQLMNKWLAVEPVKNELVTQLRSAGFTVVEPGQADVVLAMVPTAWSYQRSQQGNGVGRLDASVVLRDQKNGGAPLYQDSYWAKGSGPNIGEPEAMLRASQRLAGVFLQMLQPTRVSAVVELDDEDPITHPGIELCKQGYFDGAYQAFTDAVGRAPDSPSAAYDLAVMAEAHGDYVLAESMLQRATSRSPKPLYYAALERVRAAAQDAQSMKPQTPPAQP